VNLGLLGAVCGLQVHDPGIRCLHLELLGAAAFGQDRP